MCSFPQHGMTKGDYLQSLVSNPPRQLSPNQTTMVPLGPRRTAAEAPHLVENVLPPSPFWSRYPTLDDPLDVRRDSRFGLQAAWNYSQNVGHFANDIWHGPSGPPRPAEPHGGPFRMSSNDLNVAKRRHGNNVWLSADDNRRRDTPMPSSLRSAHDRIRTPPGFQSRQSSWYHGQSNGSSRQTSHASRTISQLDQARNGPRASMTSGRGIGSRQPSELITLRSRTDSSRGTSPFKGRAQSSNDWRNSSQSKL